MKEVLARLDAIQGMLREIAGILARQTGRAALGEVKTDLPVLPHGRRPKFWGDPEVRDFLTGLHRRVGIAEALALCAGNFGSGRTPSRSALHRYWLQLDEIVRRAA